MPLTNPQFTTDTTQALNAAKARANSAHLSFTILGKSYDSLAFESTEAISSAFEASVLILADPDTNRLDENWLGKQAVVTLIDASGHERKLAGIVGNQSEQGWNAKKQLRIKVALRPRLWILTQSRDNRVFQNLSIPDIVKQVLAQHDDVIPAASIEWKLGKTYEPLQYCIQFEETNLEFIERLLSSIGISYWFTEKEGGDVVHFSDSNELFTRLELGPIPFIADAGLDKPQASFNKFIKGSRLRPTRAQVADYNHLTPDNVVRAGDPPADPKDPVQVHYGLGTLNPDEAELRARLIGQRFAIDTLRIEIFGSAAGLLPGASFNFVHPGYPRYTGEYVVVSLTHAISQQSLIEHDNDLGNLAYSLHAHLIPRSLPFCPTFKPPLHLPMIYSARIESNGDYGLLDEHGRFKVRSLFDTRDKDAAAHTEASHPIRTMSFHGGPGGDNTVGASIPFRDDVEVIWSNIDGDANRPVILGAVPDHNTTSPVTSNNFGNNIIRTGSKNELLLHDIAGEEHIELKQGDYDRPFNLLRLDANSAGHLVKFASTLGAMQVYAKQTSKIEAGDSITQTHGNDRSETVENTHKLTTKNKEIHYQSATDQTHNASQNITHKADKNIEHRAEGSTQWRVARNSIVTIKQGDQIVKVENGSLKILAGNGISIKGNGGGSIKIGQNGAGLEIDPAGNVKLYGKAVTINGNNGVKLKGNINQAIGGAAALSLASLVPLAVAAIAPLGAEYRDAVLSFNLPAGTNASSRFVLSEDGGRYRQEKTTADDLDPNNDTLDLKYEQIPIPGTYTLTMESDQGRLVLFEKMPSASFAQSSSGAIA